MTLVKICGLTRESDIEAAVRAGADRIGFVLVPASPRYVHPDVADVWSHMARHGKFDETAPARPEVWVIAEWAPSAERLTEGLEGLLSPGSDIAVIQLHGRETPEDVVDLRRRAPARIQVWKAIGVSSREDLALLAAFDAADGFVLDAKPPAGADREGGFGHPFDWTILDGFDPGKPWMLSGGLTAATVADAIRISGAAAVDVSSGVEASPGVKDPAKVKAFIDAAKAAG